MKSKKGKECAEMLQNKLFGPFGAPRVLVSDNSGGFISEVVEAVLLMNKHHTLYNHGLSPSI